MTCMPGTAKRQERIDLESHIVPVDGGCKTEQDHISHYITGEKEGKVCGVPVRVSGGASGNCRQDISSTREEKERRDRPVHKAIELFDKPNDIETSLPRYQNKTPTLTNKRCLADEKRETHADKMEKLKEQLQQKLATRLEKKDSRFRVVEDVKPKNNVADGKKQEFVAECKAKKAWKTEKEGIENAIGKLESKDQKSEKEKQNCLLKVNLSQLKKSDSLTGSADRLKRNTTLKSVRSFELSERKCFKPLVEMNYLNKLAKKDEKGGVEYGGGWDCHRCGDRVYHAERMLACGNAYHKTCFSCVSCRKLLGPRTYLEAEMEIHCSQCHAKKFGLTGYGYGLGPGVLQTSP